MRLVSAAATRPAAAKPDAISLAVRKYWGYDRLRPLQREAIEAGLSQRDSLVVLPTGGGKSLCYQVPPLVAGRTDVVVSPLISLMKDQVDALAACGYPAAALHSGLDERSRAEVQRRLLAGEYRLLFVAPERLLTSWFLALLARVDVRAFAIDEAHCISQWGHDFRPEYRQLALLKQRFPEASVHAYTATATPRVRQDIVAQLGLSDPSLLVGAFDRPHLTYRVEARANRLEQLLAAVDRHRGEAVIVYCISRSDAEQIAAGLRAKGVRAAAYHAGLDAALRSRTQDAFAREQVDVIVATVAFGMGIDRSNVRCVVHAAMPKSIEHYQQETGRAGRDGLEAECLLLYSPADTRRWEFLMSRGAEEGKQPSEVTDAQLALLREMQRFCGAAVCRHRALAAYFGQTYAGGSCGACDVCLSPQQTLEGGAALARAIIACIRRLGGPFGVNYLIDILSGSRSEALRRRGHASLPQYGSLRTLSREALKHVIFQLIDQGVLLRTQGDRPVLALTATAARVYKGELEVQLRAPPAAAGRAAATDADTWRDVDRGLFEELRALRRTIADERGVPPFVVFGDATLRELARYRPSTPAALLRVRGVGEHKQAAWGARVLGAIVAYCGANRLSLDVAPGAPAAARLSVVRTAQPSKSLAFSLFATEKSLDDVAAATGRARGTVAAYLEDYIDEKRPPSIDAWVAPETYRRIVAAADNARDGLLRPVFDALGGGVGYDEIRIAMRHAGLR